MTNELERKIIEVIASDRIFVPVSSMDNKLKRERTSLAKGIDLKEYEGEFQGERVYARIENEDVSKARGLKEGIKVFAKEYPKYGSILKGMIEHERTKRETHLYFGTQEGSKLTADDYMGVMTSLGFSEQMSRNLYPELMNVSRKLSKQRDGEERSILIG